MSTYVYFLHISNDSDFLPQAGNVSISSGMFYYAKGNSPHLRLFFPFEPRHPFPRASAPELTTRTDPSSGARRRARAFASRPRSVARGGERVFLRTLEQRRARTRLLTNATTPTLFRRNRTPHPSRARAASAKHPPDSLSPGSRHVPQRRCLDPRLQRDGNAPCGPIRRTSMLWRRSRTTRRIHLLVLDSINNSGSIALCITPHPSSFINN